MRITKNFSLQELVYSPTALHAGIDQEEHLDNNAVARLTTLTIEVLQKVRDKFGPTKVNSCFRSRPLNELVNGSPNSQHCCFGDHTGAAAAIEIVRCMLATTLSVRTGKKFSAWSRIRSQKKQSIFQV